MVTAISDDMFTDEVITDPYTYYGSLREEDPVHWNEMYQLWVITRHDDLVWLTRHNELFSSAVFKNDQRPPYPTIYDSDLACTNSSGNTSPASLSSTTARSTWICARWCTATSLPAQWRSGGPW